MSKVRCICIDDSNRPKEIPVSKWVVKDKEYTIVHVFYHPQQKIQGVELGEVELDDSCFPYGSFALKRFTIFKEDLELFVSLLRDCTELNDIEINSLIEQCNLELV